MAEKEIRQYVEVTDPASADNLLIQTDDTKQYRKTTIQNATKRTFEYDPVYEDYLVSGHNLTSPGGSAAPTFKAFRDGFYQYAFGGASSANEGHFTLHILHDIKPNTDMSFHIHWSHNVAVPTGNVKWNVSYSLAKGYEVGLFNTSTNLSTIQAAGVQYAHHITDDDDMIVTGVNGEIEPDSVMLVKVWRDPTDAEDTFANDAFLFQIDVHYQSNRTGTTERNRPFTSGGF